MRTDTPDRPNALGRRARRRARAHTGGPEPRVEEQAKAKAKGSDAAGRGRAEKAQKAPPFIAERVLIYSLLQAKQCKLGSPNVYQRIHEYVLQKEQNQDRGSTELSVFTTFKPRTDMHLPRVSVIP